MENFKHYKLGIVKKSDDVNLSIYYGDGSTKTIPKTYFSKTLSVGSLIKDFETEFVPAAVEIGMREELREIQRKLAAEINKLIDNLFKLANKAATIEVGSETDALIRCLKDISIENKTIRPLQRSISEHLDKTEKQRIIYEQTEYDEFAQRGGAGVTK